MRKRILSNLLMIALAVVLSFGYSNTAFAAVQGTSETYIRDYYDTNGTIPVGVTAYVSTSSSGMQAPVAINTTSGITLYYDDSKSALIDAKVKQILDTENAASSVASITDNFNTAADTETASIILSGFNGIISTAVGIIVILITLGMSLATGLDVSYIAFPVIRNKMIDNKNAGGVMSKKTSDGGTTLRWITDEAQRAVEQAEVDKNSNALSQYFVKRVWVYIVLSVLLFILLTGNISIITNLALKIASGILRAIQGI